VHGLFKVYYSNVDTKIKLAFDVYSLKKYYKPFFSYDFDKDGFIRKEDVRLILSHVPIDKNLTSVGEGRFTS
jgi:Ca2+-binding EF-hand superfamily protein